jgi:hypothetical protein
MILFSTIFFVALFGAAAFYVLTRFIWEIKKIPLEDCMARCKLSSEDIAIISEKKLELWRNDGVCSFTLLSAYSDARILTRR